MLKIVFKKLERSELAKNIVKERFTPVIEKFKVTLTKSSRPGLVPCHHHGFGQNLKMKKSSENFYIATAALVDGFNQLLSRESDRLFKKNRQTRQLQQTKGKIYE